MNPPIPDLDDSEALSAAYAWLDEHTPGEDTPPEDDDRYALLLALLLLLGGAATVWAALDDLEASGAAFDNDARRLLVASLRRRWGPRGASLALAAESASQGAYGEGRMQELRRSENIAAKPVWVFDAVLDARTTELCSGFSGTTLVSSDPWWQGHTPPLHAYCRSSIRALTAEEGAPRLTVTPADDSPDPGYGRSPYRFAPRAEGYPPALWGAFAARR